MDQHIAGEQEEKNHALKNTGDSDRKAEIYLRGFSAQIRQGHQQAGKENPDWVQSSQKGDDNRCKSVTG